MDAKSAVFTAWISVLAFCLIELTSCSRLEPDIVISERCVLSKQPTIRECDTPLKITKESSAILLAFSEEWSLIDNNRIKIGDKTITLSVAVVDDKGNRHETVYYGQAFGRGKHSLTADFSGLKRGTQIRKVEVVSSVEILCERILWHSFNPM